MPKESARKLYNRVDLHQNGHTIWKLPYPGNGWVVFPMLPIL